VCSLPLSHSTVQESTCSVPSIERGLGVPHWHKVCEVYVQGRLCFPSLTIASEVLSPDLLQAPLVQPGRRLTALDMPEDLPCRWRWRRQPRRLATPPQNLGHDPNESEAATATSMPRTRTPRSSRSGPIPADPQRPRPGTHHPRTDSPSCHATDPYSVPRAEMISQTKRHAHLCE
jgi:hypothetical protein